MRLVYVSNCLLFLVCVCLFVRFVNEFTVSYIGTSQMLRYTEGATWAAVVAALVTPLGGMFWLFFELDSETNWFGWNPNFNSSSIYIIVGLLYMSPFIYFYDKEASSIKDKKANVGFGNDENGYNLALSPQNVTDDYDALLVNQEPRNSLNGGSSDFRVVM